MKHDTDECTSCGNVIVREPMQRPEVHRFERPTDEPDSYDVLDAHLCSECERKIVDFIEDDDHTEVKVDPVGIDAFSQSMQATGEELIELAEAIREYNEN